MGYTNPYQKTYIPNMSSEEQAHAVDAPADAVEVPEAQALKKTKVKDKDNTPGKPKYKDMVMDAIITQKERSGSSLGAIKNHLGSKYKVNVEKKAGILNSVLKKMREEGVLVPGAPAGRKGAGCFKVSPEEKGRIAAAAKVAARKLKIQQKQAVGKVASKAPKKIAKVGAGKRAGKKLSAKKTALGSKKPALKSTKPGGKKVAKSSVKKPSVKQPAPKMKDKSGKAVKQ